MIQGSLLGAPPTVHFGAHLAISGILRALRPRLHEVGRHGDGGRRAPSRDRRTGDAVLGESVLAPLTLSAILHHMPSEESKRAWENRHPAHDVERQRTRGVA